MRRGRVIRAYFATLDARFFKKNYVRLRNGQYINFFAVEIFTDVVLGNLDVIANGGNGHKGQDGGDAAKTRNSGKSVSL